MPCAPPVTRATFPWRLMLLTAERNRSLLYVGTQSEGGRVDRYYYSKHRRPSVVLQTAIYTKEMITNNCVSASCVRSLMPSAAANNVQVHTREVGKMNAPKWTRDNGCFYKHLYFFQSFSEGSSYEINFTLYITAFMLTQPNYCPI